MPDPNNNNQQSNSTQPDPVVPPMVTPTMDIPAMPDLINANSQTTTTTTTTTSDSGSSAPSVSFPTIVDEPKKKFGGGKGKIIATILGLFLLIGGVGTGAYLVLQNQNPNERAAAICDGDYDCLSNQYCGTDNRCHNKTTPPAPTVKPPSNGACQVCQNNLCKSTGVGGCNPGDDECSKDSDCGLPSTCSSGMTQCVGTLAVQVCVNGVWQPSTQCPNGCSTGSGVAKCNNPPTCSAGMTQCLDSNTVQVCTGSNTWQSSNCPYGCSTSTGPAKCNSAPPPPVPPPVGASCINKQVKFFGHTAESVTLTVTQAMIDNCKTTCGDATVYASKFTCKQTGLTQGCSENGITSSVGVGTITMTKPTCGSIQIDLGCKNNYYSMGTLATASYNAPMSCATPKPPVTPPTPSPTPIGISCDYKKVYKDSPQNTAGSYLLSGNELGTGANVIAGQKLLFVVKPKPAGVNNANITITDQLSTSFTFLDSDNTCSYNSANRNVTCTLTTTNTQATFRVVVANNATGTLTNTANLLANGISTTCTTNVKVQIATPTPTPVVTAQCQNVTAYSPTWTVLTASQLSALKSGSSVNFCVVGSASAGIFDKAKFTINNIAQAETTTKRPNTQDFCQSYTIPANTYSFNVTAQIHHATLGWK